MRQALSSLFWAGGGDCVRAKRYGGVGAAAVGNAVSVCVGLSPFPSLLWPWLPSLHMLLLFFSMLLLSSSVLLVSIAVVVALVITGCVTLLSRHL